MERKIKKQKQRILIVEDDKENQKYLGLILKREYEVEFCDSSSLFFDLLEQKQYSAIIMDITLKGEKNGLELTRELKNSKAYKKIPVIALSAHVFSQDRAKALEAGVQVYLTKPVDNKTLTNTLHKLVKPLALKK